MKQITDIDEGTIRRVDWQELIPPTLFFRAFGATFKPSFLLLGAVFAALFAFALGFRPTESPRLCDMNGAGAQVLSEAGSGACSCMSELRKIAPSLTLCRVTHSSDLWSGSVVPAFVLGLIAAAWFALAYSRTNVVRLTTSSRSSALASAAFAFKKFRSIIFPGLIPIGSAAALWFFAIAVNKLGAVGQAFAPIVLAIVLGIVVVAIASSLAFPFAVTAVAIENCDCFDATSRGISYVTQRFLFLILYSFFASVLIGIGFCVVEFAAELSLDVWNEAYFGKSGSWLDFWRMTLTLLPLTYCGASVVVYVNAMYVLFRRSVDGTPFDSCVLDLKGRKPRELRQILKDEKGAPEFDKTVASGSRTADASQSEPENTEK